MSRISVEIAGPSDDTDLLRLMAEMSMPGPIRIAYQRHPSYFDAMAVEGGFHQVMIGRDTESGAVVGMCNRSVKNVYVNGKTEPAGYISGLRLIKQHRGTRCLAQGYEFLKELHEDKRTAFYLASVVRNNKTAAIISKKRKYFPTWEKIASFRNMAIALNQRSRLDKNSGLDIRNAQHSDRDRIVTFLNREGKNRQFYPAYSPADLFTPGGLLKNLNPEDICLAFREDTLCGIVAAWNQQNFRQSVIRGYDGMLSFTRPLYNLGARILRTPRLPSSGSTLNYFYLSLICIQQDNTRVFAELVHHLMRQKAGEYEFMMTGMSETDPLLGGLTRFRYLNYPADLYRISLEPDDEETTGLDHRVPYLETGAL